MQLRSKGINVSFHYKLWADFFLSFVLQDFDKLNPEGAFNSNKKQFISAELAILSCQQR